MRILPDALGDDEGGGGVDGGEDFHALFLGADEAVFDVLFVGVGANELIAERGDDLGEVLFHGGLGGPALFVGRLAKVTVGDEIDGLFRKFFNGGHGV